LTQNAVLAGLRRLDKTIKMEMKQMGAHIDIRKNVILREVWDDGRAVGATALLSSLLEEKFGRLPAWASARLRKATPQQTREWGRKVLTAQTLQAVVSRR
jgi:hypothetical protein